MLATLLTASCCVQIVSSAILRSLVLATPCHARLHHCAAKHTASSHKHPPRPVTARQVQLEARLLAAYNDSLHTPWRHTPTLTARRLSKNPQRTPTCRLNTQPPPICAPRAPSRRREPTLGRTQVSTQPAERGPAPYSRSQLAQLVQAALGRARRVGVVLTPPVRWRGRRRSLDGGGRPSRRHPQAPPRHRPRRHPR